MPDKTPEYWEAVQAAADRITLDEAQRTRLAMLLGPARLVRRAAQVRPDHPVGIVHREVGTDAA